MDDLEKKGYTCDKDVITTFLVTTKGVSGVNFSCFDEDENETSFIIYNNNSLAYALEFNETCIHEIIHSLGGINREMNKKGLHYNNDIRFIHLEEAYANFLAKNISKEYHQKYGSIVDVKVDQNTICKYDRTLPYFEIVFEKYGETEFHYQMIKKKTK